MLFQQERLLTYLPIRPGRRGLQENRPKAILQDERNFQQLPVRTNQRSKERAK